MKKILITGAAGFIGFHLTKKLLELGHHIVGIDNLNDYYAVDLKLNRLKNLESAPNSKNFEFRKCDFSNYLDLTNIFKKNHKENNFDIVIHLGAQAGVRYSIDNPHSYAHSNLIGFLNILEACRHHQIEHLVYASSSSVYGQNPGHPFKTQDFVDHPISLYAATKKSNELMAHCYTHLYNFPSTALRFFTVYGPYGRPDMAYFKFTKNILKGLPIDVYNHGDMKRDFTYIDDIVDGIVKTLYRKNLKEAPYKIYNIGNNTPVRLREFITAIENACGKKAIENHLPMQPGDVPITYADIDDLTCDTGFIPTTNIKDGIEKFVAWYKSYYQAN